MFIPYAVDAPFDHRPVVNWLVLVGIVLVFVLQLVISERQAAERPKKVTEGSIEEEVFKVPSYEEEIASRQVDKKQTVTGPLTWFVLNGWGIGLFTYIWLHGGVLKGTVRLIGNLIFLLPFGNAVCSKLGNKLYLLVYLGFGLLAGVIHLIFSGDTAIGACGAISGVVGMYIVLFPENSVNCFFLLPRPMAASISGYWVILLWFVFDLLEAGTGGQGTTYCAHILCVVAGAGLAVLMLKKKWLVMGRGEKSILQMLSGDEKEEEKEKKEEKDEEEEKSLEAIDKRKGRADKEKAGPKRTSAEAERPKDDFIRFRCECGHRIKVHKKNAGKTGRCPKCLRWVEAPRE